MTNWNSEDWSLSPERLHEIASLLRQRVLQGLSAHGQELACLPTYLALPSGEQRGKALVVDTGGTNTRAALVYLSPHDGELQAGPTSRKVPDGREGAPLQADFFFSAQAEQADGFPKDEIVPLGYCFSYPIEATDDGDAILLRWTKGLRVDGTLGKRVGSLLKRQLEARGHRVSAVRVLNDTVASLLGGVHLYAEPRFAKNYIGLILGTGTNMAGVFPLGHLSKLAPGGYRDSSMVVNLESGNFHPPYLTGYDELVDQASNNPGAQRFEKAVSGHYLPRVFDAIHPGLIDPAEGSGALVRLRDREYGDGRAPAGQDATPSSAAYHVLNRSAQLAAAALVGLASLYPSGDVAVLAEGGLLWGDPHYAETVRATLRALAPERKIELVRQREDVNLLGAACAALAGSG